MRGAEAAPGLGPGALLVDVGIGSGTRDALSIADIRPVTRGEALADLENDLLLAKQWAVGVGGQLGGAWFDFRQVFTPSGNMKDQDWAIRGVIKRILVRGPPMSVFLGIGIEYGEARSWTDTRSYSDIGPRTFFTGGTARLGFNCPASSPVQLHGERRCATISWN